MPQLLGRRLRYLSSHGAMQDGLSVAWPVEQEAACRLMLLLVILCRDLAGHSSSDASLALRLSLAVTSRMSLRLARRQPECKLLPACYSLTPRSVCPGHNR